MGQNHTVDVTRGQGNASEYEGTGIGLEIFRRIVVRHGGSIQAASSPENETRFTVTLPALRPEPPTETGASLATVPAPSADPKGEDSEIKDACHRMACAPMESEFTGLFFTPGEESLLVAVQHPGERYGARNHPKSGLPGEKVRHIRIAGRDGKVFTQTRTVPIGSNFPSGIPGKAPRPSVLCIRRR